MRILNVQGPTGTNSPRNSPDTQSKWGTQAGKSNNSPATPSRFNKGQQPMPMSPGFPKRTVTSTFKETNTNGGVERLSSASPVTFPRRFQLDPAASSITQKHGSLRESTLLTKVFADAHAKETKETKGNPPNIFQFQLPDPPSIEDKPVRVSSHSVCLCPSQEIASLVHGPDSPHNFCPTHSNPSSPVPTLQEPVIVPRKHAQHSHTRTSTEKTHSPSTHKHEEVVPEEIQVDEDICAVALAAASRRRTVRANSTRRPTLTGVDEVDSLPALSFAQRIENGMGSKRGSKSSSTSSLESVKEEATNVKDTNTSFLSESASQRFSMRRPIRSWRVPSQYSVVTSDQPQDVASFDFAHMRIDDDRKKLLAQSEGSINRITVLANENRSSIESNGSDWAKSAPTLATRGSISKPDKEHTSVVSQNTVQPRKRSESNQFHHHPRYSNCNDFSQLPDDLRDLAAWYGDETITGSERISCLENTETHDPAPIASVHPRHVTGVLVPAPSSTTTTTHPQVQQVHGPASVVSATGSIRRHFFSLKNIAKS